MSAPPPKVPAYSRSRQTVVCTECKRLKIKCDRQTPCSGCAKRSNDPRVCVYLTANTERPDIGVLWNNQRESDLKIDSLAVRVDEIQDAFLPRKITVPQLCIISSSNGPVTMFPLDPITALWTTILGIPITRVDSMNTHNHNHNHNGGNSPHPYHHPSSSSSSSSTPTSRLFVADEPLHLIAAFYDHATSQLPPKQPIHRPRALITPAILNNLPSILSIEPLLSSLNSILILHPVCSFRSLETRLRAFDGRLAISNPDGNPSNTNTTNINPTNITNPTTTNNNNTNDSKAGISNTTFTVAHFAVAAASMTLASLAYSAERKAWKLPFDVPSSERDITKLFDLSRLAIRLAGDSEEERDDVLLALLFLIVFVLHATELDGPRAVASGVVGNGVYHQLGGLLDLVRRKAGMRSLLMERTAGPPAPGTEGEEWLYKREQRRMLAGAVAYYDFHVEDLISNKITIDHPSYTTESPATFDDLIFFPDSTTIPPPPGGNNTNRSTLFATQRSKILKNLLQARSEVVHGRDQERDLMIAAAEYALNKKPTPHDVGDGKTGPARIMPLSSPAGDILHMWDDRLNQQRENLPRAMIFNTSAEYAADIGIVFANDPKPMGIYEPAMTLSMGYTIAQQTEIAAIVAYYRMRFAVLLLENTLVYKPRGSPPHSTMNTAIVKALEAGQDLVAAVRVQRHVLKKKMPLALSNYGYGKRIFDAGVVFGVLASISDLRNQPRNTTRDAAEGLAQCIELLKDLEAWLRVKEGISDHSQQQQQQQQQGSAEMHQLSPPIRILEELAERAGVRIDSEGNVETVAPRRKRGTFDLEENDESWDGLILAYIMGGWVVGKPTAPTSWIGPPEVGSPLPIQTSSFPTLVTPAGGDAYHEEHRHKRACRHPTDAMARNGNGNGGVGGGVDLVSSGDEFEDPKANKRRTSDGSTGRPGSGRPVLAVRARVADIGKRPKRKPAGGAAATTGTLMLNGGAAMNGHHGHGGMNGHGHGHAGKKVKSESPMDSIEEDFEDRFAFSVNKEPAAEYSYAYAPRPGPPQQQQQQQQQSSQSQSLGLSAGLSADSGSSNESPLTPHMAPPHLQVQGYSVADAWSQESESQSQAMYGHSGHAGQMMQGQMYGQMIAQPPQDAYMHPPHHHQPPPPPQQQTQQQQPQQASSHHHHSAQQAPQHAQVAQQQHGQPQHMAYVSQPSHAHRQEYQATPIHPSHLHYGPPQPAYSGYAVETNAGGRPHPQLVIDQGLVGGGGAQNVNVNVNSQPSSAVTMGDASGFYQGIPSSAVYAQAGPQSAHPSSTLQQDVQYSQQQAWRSAQEYYPAF